MRVMGTGGSGRAGSYTVREMASAGHAAINLDVVRPPANLPTGFLQLDLTNTGEVFDAVAQFRPEGVCRLEANPSAFGFPRHQAFDNYTVGKVVRTHTAHFTGHTWQVKYVRGAYSRAFGTDKRVFDPM